MTKQLVDVGCAAMAYQDKALRNLPCKRVFVGAKEKNATDEQKAKSYGDIWTSKLAVSWLVGERLDAVEGAFGDKIDYAALIKICGAPSTTEKPYSPVECIGCRREPMSGNPDPKHILTSFVERQNLTMRMRTRRFTRLTNAFSKKVENHAHAVALHFRYYNFGRIHRTLRVTPAMAASVSDHVWTLEEIASLAD